MLKEVYSAVELNQHVTQLRGSVAKLQQDALDQQIAIAKLLRDNSQVAELQANVAKLQAEVVALRSGQENRQEGGNDNGPQGGAAAGAEAAAPDGEDALESGTCPHKVDLKDFEMIRTLGCGALGRVKFAKYTKNGKHYAVKFMKKHDIIKLKQVDHIHNEKKLMLQLDHIFIVNMLGYARDERYIYIVMECIFGGELFTHLRRARQFNNEQARFYAAQVALAFEHIHRKDIIHRDLKPENVLICPNGYAKLTNFVFAKVVPPEERTYTLCGTPEYIAPEILLNKGHGRAVDWWTVGILIYEMLVGQPPFCAVDTIGIYQKILAGKICWLKSIDKTAKALVKNLVTADLSKRYGNQRDGPSGVLKHKWFSGMDFDKLEKYEYPAPYRPAMKDATDLSNFQDIPDSKELPPVVPPEEDPFVDW